MQNIVNDQSGASAAEYSVILAIIGSGISLATISLGGSISEAVSKAAACIETAGVTCDSASAGNEGEPDGGSGSESGAETPPASETPPATETPPAAEAPPATQTPPGQGGTSPGQGGTPPGQGGTPPGQSGSAPGQTKDKDKDKDK